ncbi:hypothetical protein RB195_018538 [Necator americanus]|uniref:Uncharacterized protein n=1 Tax=Necator americanus TaxID=51031 RepID=A0ABR1CA77_NECAM
MQRDFVKRRTTMTASRNLNGATTASRKGMKETIHAFYTDLFDSYTHLPPHHPKGDRHAILELLPPEVQHAIMLVVKHPVLQNKITTSEELSGK